MDSVLPKQPDPELEFLLKNKQSGFKYRERRQDDWTENYILYRDSVRVNRITQRQSVNLPLMKQTIRTLITNVDDMPVITFENLDNDTAAEVFQNEYWNYIVEKNKMELKDVVDKRQVFFFGRTFDQWQIIDGCIHVSIVDPEDILVDRYVDPTNIHSSRFLIHTHIFVPLSKLEENPDYDQEKVAELKKWYGTMEGLLKNASNRQSMDKRNQKMADLGLQDPDSPILGETIVELTLHFVYRPKGTVYKDKDGNKQSVDEEQIFLYVEADDQDYILKKPLEKVIGVTEDNFFRNHFPYNSWADDLDMQDFWTDGVADIMRTPNKIANAWFSQMVENRTLRNLNMQVYDATIEGFNPQTYEPKAFGWLGVPGKPTEVYQQLQVADLSDSLDELTFLIGMGEKATGATSNLQGVENQKQITLGEVKVAYNEAKERVKGMSKFYTQAWIERGELFLKLIEAGKDKLDAVKIYKNGRNTDTVFSKEIAPEDWMTKSGYRTKVWSQDEKSSQDTEALQKITGVKQLFPGNQKLDEITERKALEFADLKPDEIAAVMEVQQKNREAQMAMMNQGGMGAPGMETQPAANPNPTIQPPTSGAMPGQL